MKGCGPCPRGTRHCWTVSWWCFLRWIGRPGRRDVREALDQLELGGDLAALVGDLLLGTVIAVSMNMLDTDEGETYASSLDASAPSLRET